MTAASASDDGRQDNVPAEPIRVRGRRLFGGRARSLLRAAAKDAGRLVAAGDAAMARRDWAAAVDAYDQALAVQATASPTWVQYGHALKELGRRDEAVYAYRRALELVPLDTETLLHLAHLRLAMNDRDGATEDFGRILETGEESRAADEAREIIEQLRRDASASVSLALGDEAMRRRRWSEATHAYASYLRAKPETTPIWVQYGHSLKEQGFLREALRAYQEALRQEPNDADARTHLTGVLAQIGYRLPQHLRKLESEPAVVDSALEGHAPLPEEHP